METIKKYRNKDVIEVIKFDGTNFDDVSHFITNRNGTISYKNLEGDNPWFAVDYKCGDDEYYFNIFKNEYAVYSPIHNRLESTTDEFLQREFEEVPITYDPNLDKKYEENYAAEYGGKKC